MRRGSRRTPPPRRRPRRDVFLTSWQQQALLFAASAVAGAINSVAGGGTLLTFPALLAAGQTAIMASATNTVALWPGQASSLWGYRDDIRRSRGVIVPLGFVGLAGGALGAWLLTKTPVSVFDRAVPFLILMATALFIAQEPIGRWQKSRAAAALAATTGDTDAAATVTAPAPPLSRLTLGAGAFLLLVAIYGGYFGAGIGILTLAAFGLMGMTDIHQMNGVKAAFTLGVNGIASLVFIQKGMVDWRFAGVMTVGSVVGGYAGAGIARRMGQKNVRRLVIAIGLVLSLSLLIKH